MSEFRAIAALGLVPVLGLSQPALAATPAEEAQQAQLDKLRASVANEIQLTAYDLIDELVYGLKVDPVFDKPTPVVIAGVSVPVGLGTGMAALVENHLADVVGQNPATNLQLVYCPACTAVIVHSGPEATVLSRGVDDPRVLEQLGGDTGRLALFVDIEAEGTWLVLRAHMTRLTPDLPIVWSHTIASNTSTPSLLRQASDLKSAEDARQEYLDALHDRGPISVPLRFAVRAYAHPDGDSNGVPPPPFIWLQSGVEIGTTDARAWTSSLLVGYSLVPQAYQGLMSQGRVSRLLNGGASSLTTPNLYGFVGGAVFTVWGPATAPFTEDTLTIDEILLAVDGDDPRYTFGALHAGVDLRVGERVGISTFLEAMPSLRNSDNIGNYVRVANVEFQSLGTEVTFWF